MHVAIVHNALIPATKYGGIERVIIWLGKELVKQGHRVTYLIPKGSTCHFADVIFWDDSININTIIPKTVDVVHIHCGVSIVPEKPYIITMHGNTNEQWLLNKNTVFVSKNHANRFGSEVFVHNGLDPVDYGKPSLTTKKKYLHFLGDAAWRVKNIKGAIKIAQKSKMPLEVIGGVRFNFNQGLRFTFSPSIHFHGMIGGETKNKILDQSSGLIFPVRWHEPFGLAIIESLYFGCPVFATTYGSLPEIVNSQVGFLSNKSDDLIEAVKNYKQFNANDCHDYVLKNFTSHQMTNNYLLLYEKVLKGEALNSTNPTLQQVQNVKFLDFE